MRPAFARSALALFAILPAVLSATSASAGSLACTGQSWLLDGRHEQVDVPSVTLKAPAKAAPGLRRGRTLMIIAGHLVDVKASVQTQGLQTLMIDFVAFDLGQGDKRRAVGSASSDNVSAKSVQIPGCDGTICVAATTANVDVLTAIANQKEELTPAQLYERGLMSGETPADFSVNCTWSK